MQEKLLEKRIYNYAIFFLIVVLVIVGRLWYLQIVQGEHYARLAEGNRLRRLQLSPARGVIYDRDGDIMVRSRPAFTVSLVPGGIPEDAADVLSLLGDILELTSEEIEEFIDAGQGFPYEPVRVIRDIDVSKLIAIEENRANLPGVFIEEEPVREYLFNGLASHVIGHLGAISEQELRVSDGTYSSLALVGKSGIEKLYEDELRGQAGSQTVEVNALSRAIQTIGYEEPIPGFNLKLTIDKDIQKVAEESFINHTAIVRERFPDAYNGVVVALDPRTGEIYALVSVPDYDPSKLLDTTERNNYYRDLLNDASLPFFNRALQGQYGPGSSFKPFTAVAMLEEGVVDPKSEFNATGISRYGVRDWVITQGLAPFGSIDFTDALAVSSNHYFAEYGVELGIDRLSEWTRKFGFGGPTGLAFAPREVKGIVPDREWKRKTFSHKPRSEQVWYATDTEQVSIGQGFLSVTPLQLAMGYSVIANRGSAYKPTLVSEVINHDGDVVKKHIPEVNYHVDVSDESWEEVINGMKAVIEHPRGTARGAFEGFPISVAGKTGSYELPGSDAHGLFAGFAPIEEPEIVVLAIVEHGGGGGTGAAPIVRAVLDEYFQLEETGEGNAGINE